MHCDRFEWLLVVLPATDGRGKKMFQPQIHPLIRALPAIALLVGGLALVLLLFG
jgi:hypothetical protein